MHNPAPSTTLPDADSCVATEKQPPSRERHRAPPEKSLLIDLDATAQLLGVSRKTAQRLVDAGELPGICRIRRRVMINRAKLENWIAEGCPEQPPQRNR